MSRHRKSLASQVIVITGATSCIGLNTARMASRQGATLILAASNATTLARLASELRQAGGEVLAVPVDVACAAQVAAFGRMALQRFGRIDTWINAGMAMDDQVDAKPAPVAARLFTAHYCGASHGAQAARDVMAQDGGVIINVDSDACVRHGVKGWTDTLRAGIEADGLPLAVTLVHAAGRNDMHNAPRLVAEAILQAARQGASEAPRDMVVGSARPAPARGATPAAPRFVDKCREFFTLHLAHRASRT